MHKVAAGVLGASGYTGRELCSLVEAHPNLDLVFAAANEQRGVKMKLGGRTIAFTAPEETQLEKAEIVFSALPHGTSHEWVARAQRNGSKVVDLSSDLRPGNTESPAIYGLTELTRDAVRTAITVANPGCYPTAILLALAPFVCKGMIAENSTINVVAASGVTGAGFSAKPELLFGEVTENFKAYSTGNQHRHLPEMRAMLASWNASNIDLIFTPQLLPVARGILATITIELASTTLNPLAELRSFFEGERFIEISETAPTLRDVVRRNIVRISAIPAANVSRPVLLLFSAIDNLIKGAAGQAVQNANLMLGFPEAAGLPG